METKITTYQTQIINALQRLRDVRVIGLMLFAVIVLMMSWSGVKVIDTNFKLQKQISGLEQENQLRQLENTNAKLTNQYYQTDQYLELSARQNFGMARPGESVLSVPRQVALDNTVASPSAQTAKKPSAGAKQPFYQRNFQAWMNFLFHRETP